MSCTHPFHSKVPHNIYILLQPGDNDDGRMTMPVDATGHMQALVAAAGGVRAQQLLNWPEMDN